MILLRHGRPATTGTCYGRSDPPLAEPPAQLARRVAAVLPPVDRCFASPSPRCLDLARALHADPVPVPALRELDFGSWEGLRWDDVDRAELDAWAAAPLDHRVGGGERGRDVHARVATWLAGGAGEPDRAIGPPGPDDLVVGHAGSIRALAAVVLGEPFETTWRWPVPHAVPLRVHATGLRPA